MADRASLVSLLQALSRTSPTASVADFALAERPQDYAVPMDVRPATMRAPTLLERMRGAVEQGVATVADQPLLRVLDLLAAGGGIRAIADGQSPPLVSMGEAQRKRVPNPIKAYHGSPHDFDQFSMEKIGTGEGAQAYGHGLYFAEAEPVARNYRPKPVVVYNSASHGGKHVVMAGNEVLSTHTSSDAANRALARAKAGKMYEVNIHADPESFLDWDKPLSQQPPDAQLKLRAAFPWLDRSDPSRVSRATVSQIIEQADMGGPAAASDAMRSAGVPGIRYLDAGSRNAQMGLRMLSPKESVSGKWVVGNAPNGPNQFFNTEQEARAAMEALQSKASRNYVVFDDSLIEILRKYGLLPFAAGLGARADEQ